MLKKLSITWNDDWSNDGLLYFGQRIVEMLDYSTTDIYRTPLLNTSRLIDEYISISRTTNNPNQLKLVKEEFLYTFRSDEVLKYKYTPSKLEQLISLVKSASDPFDAFSYLNNTIGRNYLLWCKEYLRYIVRQPREKKKIESAIRCFVPELLRCGYSRDEMYHNAKEILLSDNTNPDTALEEFLDIYNNDEKEYTVYMLFKKQIEVFQDILSKRLNLDFTTDAKAGMMNTQKQFVVAKMQGIKALDASNAANIAIRSIELFLDFYQFLGNYDSSLAQKTVWVYDSKETCRKLVVNREKYNSIEVNSQTQVGQMSELLINGLISGARCSMERLIEIVKMHNRAISNNGLENGFLNLWAILEIICVSDLEGKKAEQVINELVPVLQKDYLVEIFNDINRNLKQILSCDEYEKLLDIVEEENNPVKKTAMLLLLDKYESRVDVFVDKLVNYPVLRTRILNIRDNCHTMSNLYDLSERYAQRVSWHISRIYRARNGIIHSGKTTNDIKDLGEHLHVYVDCIVLELLIQLGRGSLCSFKNVLIDSRLRREALFAELSKPELFSAKEIDMLFDNGLFCVP